MFFLIFIQNIDCGYLEPHRRGGSNVTVNVLSKNISNFKKTKQNHCVLHICKFL